MKNKLIKKCLKGYPLRNLTELELVQTGYAPAVGRFVGTGVRALPEIGKWVATLPFVVQTAEQLRSFELPQFSTSVISNYLRNGIPTSSSAPSKKSYPRVTSPADNKEIEKEISREIVESWPYRQNIMVLGPLDNRYITSGFEIPEGYIYPKGTIYETLPTIHLGPVELIAPRVMSMGKKKGENSENEPTAEPALDNVLGDTTQQPALNGTLSSDLDPKDSETQDLKRRIQELEARLNQKGWFKGKVWPHIRRNWGHYIGYPSAIGVGAFYGSSNTAPSDSTNLENIEVLKSENKVLQNLYKNDSINASNLNKAIQNTYYK